MNKKEEALFELKRRIRILRALSDVMECSDSEINKCGHLIESAIWGIEEIVKTIEEGDE